MAECLRFAVAFPLHPPVDPLPLLAAPLYMAHLTEYCPKLALEACFLAIYRLAHARIFNIFPFYILGV